MSELIDNATILRIDTLAAPTAGGDPVYVTGAACSIRCTTESFSFAQKMQVDALQIDANSKLMIDLNLVAAYPSLYSCRMLVQGDNETSPQTLVVKSDERISGDLSYALLLMRNQ